MRIILKQNVAGIGNKGEIKNVSDGHAINFLFPRGLALLATPQAVKNFELERIRNDAERQIQSDLLAKNLAVLKNEKIIIKSKASETGGLFAGIHKEEIVHAIKHQMNLDIPLNLIELEQPIKHLGEHKIKVDGIDFELEVERE